MNKLRVDRFTGEIPAFLERMKEITEQLTEHYIEREKQSMRIRDAKLYFNKDLTNQEWKEGLSLMHELMYKISKTDLDIRELQMEFCMVMEAKAVNFYGVLALDDHKDASGNSLSRRDVLISPWQSFIDVSEKRAILTPNDVWMIRILQKMFSLDPLDVQPSDFIDD